MVCIKFPILVYFYLFWSFVSRWWDFNEGRRRACYCCTTTTIVFDAIFLYLLQQLSLLGHFWVQLQKHKLACINVLCLPTSVTRCQSKKQPNFLKKLLKKYQFNIKVPFSQQPKMLLDIWAFVARNFVPKNFQKSPNLVTLSPTQI